MCLLIILSYLSPMDTYFLEPGFAMDFKCTYSLDCVEELLRENTPTQYPEKALGDLNKKNCLY